MFDLLNAAYGQKKKIGRVAFMDFPISLEVRSLNLYLCFPSSSASVLNGF